MLDVSLFLVGLIAGAAPTYLIYLFGRHGYPGGEGLTIGLSLVAPLFVIHIGNLAIERYLPGPVKERSLWEKALLEAAPTWFVPFCLVAFTDTLTGKLSGTLALMLGLPIFVAGPVGSWWTIRKKGQEDQRHRISASINSEQSTETPGERQLELVVESVRLLAMDADIQMGCFPKFVHIPDEIVCTFADWYDMFRDQLIKAGFLTEDQDLALRRIHHYIRRISRNGDLFREELWTCEAIQNDQEWQTLRDLATESLRILNQEKRPPGDLGSVYVPAGPL